MTTAIKEPKTKRLHEVLAIKKGVEERARKKFEEVQQALVRPDLFKGIVETWQALDENGEQFEPNNQKVQAYAREIFNDALNSRKEVLNIDATIDATNAVAKADIIVDDHVIMADVPATALLAVEKELQNILTMIKSLPTPDTAEEWTKDQNHNYLQRTLVQKVARSKKVETVEVMYPHTTEHPAQTRIRTEDKTIGYWNRTKLSGAIPLTEKVELYKRTAKVLDAVKEARERANSAVAVDIKVGSAIVDYLLTSGSGKVQ